MIHEEILIQKQKDLLSFIGLYTDKFVLVWWTAIALQLGHRRSIDFDLFYPSNEYLPVRYMQKNWKQLRYQPYLLYENSFQQHYAIHDVKVTFFAYMYDIPQKVLLSDRVIPMPNCYFLAAMKIHAIAQRHKRKDYVDIAFLIRQYGIQSISDYTKKIFWSEYNIRLFCSQLCYFDDIDYSEEVDYMPWFERNQKDIQLYLKDQSVKLFDYAVSQAA